MGECCSVSFQMSFVGAELLSAYQVPKQPVDVDVLSTTKAL